MFANLLLGEFPTGLLFANQKQFFNNFARRSHTDMSN